MGLYINNAMVEEDKKQDIYSYLGSYGRPVSELFEGTKGGPNEGERPWDDEIFICFVHDTAQAVVMYSDSELEQWKVINKLKTWFIIKKKWVERYCPADDWEAYMN